MAARPLPLPAQRWLCDQEFKAGAVLMTVWGQPSPSHLLMVTGPPAGAFFLLALALTPLRFPPTHSRLPELAVVPGRDLPGDWAHQRQPGCPPRLAGAAAGKRWLAGVAQASSCAVSLLTPSLNLSYIDTLRSPMWGNK